MFPLPPPTDRTTSKDSMVVSVTPAWTNDVAGLAARPLETDRMLGVLPCLLCDDITGTDTELDTGGVISCGGSKAMRPSPLLLSSGSGVYSCCGVKETDLPRKFADEVGKAFDRSRRCPIPVSLSPSCVPAASPRKSDRPSPKLSLSPPTPLPKDAELISRFDVDCPRGRARS